MVKKKNRKIKNSLRTLRVGFSCQFYLNYLENVQKSSKTAALTIMLTVVQIRGLHYVMMFRVTNLQSPV